MRKLIEAIRLRWRLWWVCRKIGIKPYEFQREFALTGRCTHPIGRRNGKTMAVMLYGLIRDMQYMPEVYMLATRDPDVGRSYMRRDVFAHEYYRLWQTVKEGGR